MKNFLALLAFLSTTSSFAQNNFPQAQINSQIEARNSELEARNPKLLTPVLTKIEELKKCNSDPRGLRSANPSTQILDTLIVGLTPNDTVRISGIWNHTGPIWVLGTGVLIFNNATVHDTGDVYVFGNGQWIADSSDFYFPQNYFYERGFLVLQNASATFTNCSTNYSGLSHSLVIANNGVVNWTNMHNNDWTTCGLYGNPTMNIHGCNISGEYVITDTSHINFVHADTVILWHQFPPPSVINYSFPNTNPVYNYQFNNTLSGVSGVQYDITADSCSDVMWAIMPVNGSDVTLSNSNIRLIGAWFEFGDTTSASGIINNSTYVNFTAPLVDRNLHLINSNVQTWSFYVFDVSQVTIDSCQLGEIGTQQGSSVIATRTITDGTGGYFWATDSSYVSATNCISYSTCRSERIGKFLLAYSWLPFTSPTAIHNSEIICMQNTLFADPVPYDGSVAWLGNIEGPDTASENVTFPIIGSAWINQGPLGNPVDFGSYSIYYRDPFVTTTWTPIVLDSTTEISHSVLANWNTWGVPAGTYVLRLVLKDNSGDSAEALRVIVLTSNPNVVQEIAYPLTLSAYPNPFGDETHIHCSAALHDATLELYNTLGQCVRVMEYISGNDVLLSRGDLPSGSYMAVVRMNGNVVERVKVVVK